MINLYNGFQLEEQLVEFHLGNLEFACGSRLEDVSARHWDQNDPVPQFSGPPLTLQASTRALLEGLAKGVDVNLNCEVGVNFYLVNCEECYTGSPNGLMC